MIVTPKFRGFICTTSHPVGCEYSVMNQVEYIKNQKKINGAKKVLVIGASTGYGLASRITAAFGCGAATIGIFFERPGSKNKTASAGWYNSAAFEKMAKEEGLYAKSINGDAFSNEIKQKTIDLIKKDLGKVDMVVYSLASPRRTHPVTGEVFNSVIKPIREAYTSKTVDFHTQLVSETTIEPASDDEIRQTIAVMGGEDWSMWMDALKKADVLEDNVMTLAYSYVGPEVTHSVYREGTIGKAKDDLEATAIKINENLRTIGGKAYVSINKAVVTQASAAIPVISLYVSALFKVMKEKNIHEGCIEQMYRMFNDRLYSGDLKLDSKGRICMDDLEMRPEVQNEVTKLWNEANNDNVKDITDIEGYRREFFRLFGFEFEDVDYNADVDIEVNIEGLY
ncbi:enoyl-ACP reductase FabV [Ruminiclostridium cellulolyticum]|uniref:Trans-2-enoyl-CoA reductase [NADH] n=1 Tax=Ruminiclostridium cellulolyticum (strain ATCC 35319 / DSM 5812 / JCM 6584 / H10) TaxID=394503 RepID=FABV_RUMCH|nr:enoyl-ACP reductase FabV [Ruminiclostridium cellulolyticum]B8I4V6.1 RecName: Full=Trans-2-enoyl-CoA reductase [NADH]; Short=TER [Ruminiclostridium cellulolyticum H10]ACL76610.1 short-chain alcohol dehydrogenase [Ruminiclostridium cellulolyticum H10]